MSVVCLRTFRENKTITEFIPVIVSNTEKPKEKKPMQTRQKIGGLYYYPRLDRWKASNVSLDPTMMKAWSYDWWVMLDMIDDQLIFNEYRYSNSTSKHQSKVRSWLRTKDFDYVEISSPRGLQDLESSVAYYQDEINALEKQIAKPGTRKAKNLERQKQITELKAKQKIAKRLSKLKAKAS